MKESLCYRIGISGKPNEMIPRVKKERKEAKFNLTIKERFRTKLQNAMKNKEMKETK